MKATRRSKRSAADHPAQYRNTLTWSWSATAQAPKPTRPSNSASGSCPPASPVNVRGHPTSHIVVLRRRRLRIACRFSTHGGQAPIRPHPVPSRRRLEARQPGYRTGAPRSACATVPPSATQPRYAGAHIRFVAKSGLTGADAGHHQPAGHAVPIPPWPAPRRATFVRCYPCRRGGAQNGGMKLPVMPPVAPMLAKSVATIPWSGSYEPKWDGFRSIIFRDGDEVEIGSRNERPMTRYFPEL